MRQSRVAQPSQERQRQRWRRNMGEGSGRRVRNAINFAARRLTLCEVQAAALGARFRLEKSPARALLRFGDEGRQSPIALRRQ